MSYHRIASAMFGAVSLLVLAACGANPALDDGTPDIVRQEEPPAGQLPTGVAPTVYRLNLVTDPSAAGFTGDVEIDVSLDAPHARIWLHAEGPNVINAFARLPDGTEVPATFTGRLAPGGVSRLDFQTPLPAGQATLVMDYEAPYNLALAGLYKVTQGGRDYLASQMQAIDARRMVPGFDEPRFKTPWVLSVTAPEGLKVIANGAELDAEPAGDGMTRHTFAPTRPIPSYLLGLAVGPYDESPLHWIDPASGLRPAPVPLRGFAAAGKGEKLSEALNITQPMLLWQENYFGQGYPYGKLDLIAAPDFAWGAMENAGAIIYREAALLIDERTTLARRRGIFTTHAHELAHQWFGNLVTPRWWNDIWLNESFATWMSYKTMHAIDPEGEWDLSPIAAGMGAMRADSLKNARQIRNPIADNGDIEDAFDSITYSKGGSVLNMFETYLGEERFREGIRLHMRRFQDNVADIDDFMQSLSQGAGDEEAVDSFRSFILQPGIPMLEIDIRCAGGAGARMSVKQSRYAPLGSEIDTGALSWRVPFSATVARGNEITTERWMLSSQMSELQLDHCPDYVMPNAGGTGYWRFALDEGSAAKLAENFSRLSAGEQMTYLDSLVAGFESGRVSPESLLNGLEASTFGSAAAIGQPFASLSAYHSRLAEAEQAVFSTWIEQTYGPVEKRLAARPQSSLTDRETLLRNSVNGLLMSVGDRPAARAMLLRKAEAYIGFERAPDPGALEPQDLGTAIRIGVREKGKPFADAALAFALASENQTERAAILSAVAGSADASHVADIIASLADMPISSSELFTILSSAMRTGATAAGSGDMKVWQTFEAHFDAILQKMPEVRRQQVGSFVGMLCSAEDAARADAFFKGKAERIPGHERGLAQGTEQARLCEARSELLLPGLAAALTDRGFNAP